MASSVIKAQGVKIVETIYNDFTIAANSRGYFSPTAPSVGAGFNAHLINARIAANVDVTLQGVNNNTAFFYNATSSEIDGTDYPTHCTWLIIPNS